MLGCVLGIRLVVDCAKLPRLQPGQASACVRSVRRWIKRPTRPTCLACLLYQKHCPAVNRLVWPSRDWHVPASWRHSLMHISLCHHVHSSGPSLLRTIGCLILLMRRAIVNTLTLTSHEPGLAFLLGSLAPKPPLPDARRRPIPVLHAIRATAILAGV